jgi:hypothetical protein
MIYIGWQYVMIYNLFMFISLITIFSSAFCLAAFIIPYLDNKQLEIYHTEYIYKNNNSNYIE